MIRSPDTGVSPNFPRGARECISSVCAAVFQPMNRSLVDAEAALYFFPSKLFHCGEKLPLLFLLTLYYNSLKNALLVFQKVYLFCRLNNVYYAGNHCSHRCKAKQNI